MKKWNTHIAFIMVGLAIVSQIGSARTIVDMQGSEISGPAIHVHVFPNPSDGNFKLELRFEVEGKPAAKIYDMTGKLLEDISDQLIMDRQAITGDINLKEVSSGIHFLRIEIGKTTATKKIIIK